MTMNEHDDTSYYQWDTAAVVGSTDNNEINAMATAPNIRLNDRNVENLLHADEKFIKINKPKSCRSKHNGHKCSSIEKRKKKLQAI